MKITTYGKGIKVNKTLEERVDEKLGKFSKYFKDDATATVKVKPDKDQVKMEVTMHIQKAGFKIIAMKMVRLTSDTAGGFYEVHKERPFFGELCDFMSSGPCVPIILEKDNAVADFRKLIGATDPAEAEEGTIRQLFADSKGENIVHGSDSDENAAIESAYFFTKSEEVANLA